MKQAASVDLAIEPRSARRAREVLEPFREFLDARRFGDLRLIVSELVADAVGSSDLSSYALSLRAELRGNRVRASLEDRQGLYRAPSRRPDPGDPGWSVYLVQTLSDSWGLMRNPKGSAIWLEMSQS